MAKSSKRRGTSADLYDQKPDFAMDFARNPPQKPKVEKAPEPAQHALTIEDRIQSKAVSQLAQLKKDMETAMAQAAAAVPQQVSPRAVNPPRPQATRSEGLVDPHQTFQEMFDPQPEDDVDFDTLLHDSKQDWREYK